MDVKTTFMHSSIKEEVYVEQPEGFEIHDRESLVCKLKKAIYGLKQAPRAWYERINSYLMKMGFTRSKADLNLYFKVENDKPLILVLYLDDLFLTGADPLIQKCKKKLAYEFEMKDLGPMNYFLGLEVWKNPVWWIARALLDVVFMGSASISWMSRKQKSVALSTAKDKCIAASMASYEAIWLRKLFSELFGNVLVTTIILCNNQSGIRLSENLVFHDRSKHIDIMYHFIQDMVKRGEIRLHHIGTNEQVVDVLTKPLGKVKFLAFQERLGFMERSSYEGPV
eukprot:PITA_19601